MSNAVGSQGPCTKAAGDMYDHIGCQVTIGDNNYSGDDSRDDTLATAKRQYLAAAGDGLSTAIEFDVETDNGSMLSNKYCVSDIVCNSDESSPLLGYPHDKQNSFPSISTTASSLYVFLSQAMRFSCLC